MPGNNAVWPKRPSNVVWVLGLGLDEAEDGHQVALSFSIFNPKHRNEFTSLAAIEDDGVDRRTVNLLCT